MSWMAGRCWAGEPAAAVAGVEVEAWSGTARWLEDQTCCYRSQMLTPQLLVEGGGMVESCGQNGPEWY